MAEKADGGDDGVVYLGRSSFKMKGGFGSTPAEMAAAARLAATPPAGVTSTPAPILTRTRLRGVTPHRDADARRRA